LCRTANLQLNLALMIIGVGEILFLVGHVCNVVCSIARLWVTVVMKHWSCQNRSFTRWQHM